MTVAEYLHNLARIAGYTALASMACLVVWSLWWCAKRVALAFRRTPDTQEMAQAFIFDEHLEHVAVVRMPEKCRYPELAGKLSVPGGHVKAGESPRAAAARELEEETGLVVDPSELRYVGQYPSSVGIGAPVYCYAAKVRRGEGRSFVRVGWFMSREDCTPNVKNRVLYAMWVLENDREVVPEPGVKY